MEDSGDNGYSPDDHLNDGGAQKKLIRLRDGLVDKLKLTERDRLPTCGAEFWDWANFSATDVKLLRIILDDDAEKVREWIFDICLKSGRFEHTEDGSDLRIKA